jgi:hypothetical protein
MDMAEYIANGFNSVLRCRELRSPDSPLQDVRF